MILSIPWVKRIVNRVQKDIEELEVENIESIIDFDSKATPASIILTYNTTMFSTS
jgi:hypothetical protein